MSNFSDACRKFHPGFVNLKIRAVSHQYIPKCLIDLKSLTVGLGRLSVLDDDILLSILGALPADALAALSLSSKALYCFSNHEELWKALVLQVIEISL